MDRKCFQVPTQAFLREHQVDRRALGLVAIGAVLKGDAITNSPLAAKVQGFEPEWLYCAMFFMQFVHEGPAIFLAPER